MTMKILLKLIAMVALMMTLQVNASIVSYPHEVSNTISTHSVQPFIRDLFGRLDAGEIVNDYSHERPSRNSRRHGQISRFGSLQDISVFFRRIGIHEALRFIRERELNHPEDFIVTGNEVKLSTITNTPGAVPVPAALWLFGSGIAGLFAFSYRRQA